MPLSDLILALAPVAGGYAIVLASDWLRGRGKGGDVALAVALLVEIVVVSFGIDAVARAWEGR